MIKKKVIHLHTDPKFIYDSCNYQSEYFDNIILFLGTKTDYIEKQTKPFQCIYIDKDLAKFSEINNLLQSFDIVVFYELCDFKIKLLEQYQKKKNQQFILRLFGYELYAKLFQYYVSAKTYNSLYPIRISETGLVAFLKSKLIRILNIKSKFTKISYRQDIYGLFDYITLFNEFEYKELSEKFTLPSLLKVPLVVNPNFFSSFEHKKNILILGNSRHSWNNHLDILDKIEGIKDNEIDFYLFFNYGPDNNYTTEVLSRCESRNNFRIIDTFLDKNKFEEIYSQAGALVINSYRQHALGNIFTAIFNGVKIYLNHRSSTYKWLIFNGFLVYDVKDLNKHIKLNQIKLTLEQANYNINCYLKLKQGQLQDDFVRKLYENQLKKELFC